MSIHIRDKEIFIGSVIALMFVFQSDNFYRFLINIVKALNDF